MDHCALLGTTKKTVDRAARRGDHGTLGLAATAAGRTAATVEEHDADACFAREPGQCDLGLLQRPARRDKTTILRTVGITEHDDLTITARRKMCAIQAIGEQRAHDVFGGIKIVDGLEQRRDIERHAIRCIDATGDAREVRARPARRQHSGSC